MNEERRRKSQQAISRQPFMARCTGQRSIPADYVSLFAPLRKRTRETGVSTLEALTLAVEVEAATTPEPAHLRHVAMQLRSMMKHYVDTCCVLKHTDIPYSSAEKDGDFFQDIVAKEKAHTQAQQIRYGKDPKPVAVDFDNVSEEVRALLPPAVTNMCTVCDNLYVGWLRMPEHVVGASHQRNLQKQRELAFKAGEICSVAVAQNES